MNVKFEIKNNYEDFMKARNYLTEMFNKEALNRLEVVNPILEKGYIYLNNTLLATVSVSINFSNGTAKVEWDEKESLKESLLEGYPVQKHFNNVLKEMVMDIVNLGTRGYKTISSSSNVAGAPPFMGKVNFSTCDGMYRIEDYTFLCKDGKVQFYPTNEEKIYWDESWCFDLGIGYKWIILYALKEISDECKLLTQIPVSCWILQDIVKD